MAFSIVVLSFSELLDYTNTTLRIRLTYWIIEIREWFTCIQWYWRVRRWYLTIKDNNEAVNHRPTNGNSLQKGQSITSEKLSQFAKRILIVDDDPDTTFTFKKGLVAENEENSDNKIFFKVDAYNNPLQALAEFKPDFYDLILIDINMPKMDGLEFSAKILDLDVNPRICLMSSGMINQEALREQHPSRGIGCFIKKPVTIEYLVRRIKTELE